MTTDQDKYIRKSAKNALRWRGFKQEEINIKIEDEKIKSIKIKKHSQSLTEKKDPNIFIDLWNSKNDQDRKKLLKYHDLPPDFCRELIALDPKLRLTIAVNKSIPLDLVYELSDDLDYRVRLSILSRDNCPSEIIEKYTKDSHEKVRYCVALRKNTSDESLLVLRNDPVVQVRKAAIHHLKSKKKELDLERAKVEARFIRSADKYLELWSADYDPDIQRRLSEAIVPIEVCREVISREPNSKTMLLWNKHVPIELLYELSDDPDENVREKVLGKVKCPQEIIIKLSTDSSSRIRCAVADDPFTPKEVLIKLLDDPDIKVRRRARIMLRERHSY